MPTLTPYIITPCPGVGTQTQGWGGAERQEGAWGEVRP